MPTVPLRSNTINIAGYGVGGQHSQTHANGAAGRHWQSQPAMRDHPQAKACLPNIHELTAIRELEPALANTSIELAPDLSWAIWEQFDHNTQAHDAKFASSAVQFRPNDNWGIGRANGATSRGLMSGNPAARKHRIRDTRPEDVARFADVPLMSTTAIVDHSRCGPYGRSEFLHANAIHFEGCRKFIASQCPTSTEIPGLWQMVSKNRVPLIVDLVESDQYESGEMGSQQYSPGTGLNRGTNADLSAACGVTCEKRETFGLRDGYAIKSRSGAHQASNDVRFVIENLKIRGRDGGEHRMQRLHFPVWKDFGTVSPAALRSLANTVESLSPDPDRPILVHCLAGVGRTGSLISFITARQEIKAAIQNGTACSPTLIVKTLLNVIAYGRLNRGPRFVQTDEQFKLLTDALTDEFRADLIRAKTRPTLGGGRTEGRLRGLHAQAKPTASHASVAGDGTTFDPRNQGRRTTASEPAPQRTRGLWSGSAPATAPLTAAPTVKRTVSMPYGREHARLNHLAASQQFASSQPPIRTQQPTQSGRPTVSARTFSNTPSYKGGGPQTPLVQISGPNGPVTGYSTSRGPAFSTGFRPAYTHVSSPALRPAITTSHGSFLSTGFRPAYSYVVTQPCSPSWASTIGSLFSNGYKPTYTHVFYPSRSSAWPNHFGYFPSNGYWSNYAYALNQPFGRIRIR